MTSSNSVAGASVEFTAAEFNILAYLAERPGRAVTRDTLLERCLPEDTEASRRTIDTHVARIRKKLGEDADKLATVWGIGYRIVE